MFFFVRVEKGELNSRKILKIGDEPKFVDLPHL